MTGLVSVSASIYVITYLLIHPFYGGEDLDCELKVVGDESTGKDLDWKLKIIGHKIIGKQQRKWRCRVATKH